MECEKGEGKRRRGTDASHNTYKRKLDQLAQNHMNTETRRSVVT